MLEKFKNFVKKGNNLRYLVIVGIIFILVTIGISLGGLIEGKPKIEKYYSKEDILIINNVDKGEGLVDAAKDGYIYCEQEVNYIEKRDSKYKSKNWIAINDFGKEQFYRENEDDFRRKYEINKTNGTVDLFGVYTANVCGKQTYLSKEDSKKLGLDCLYTSEWASGTIYENATYPEIGTVMMFPDRYDKPTSGKDVTAIQCWLPINNFRINGEIYTHTTTWMIELNEQLWDIESFIVGLKALSY